MAAAGEDDSDEKVEVGEGVAVVESVVVAMMMDVDDVATGSEETEVVDDVYLVKWSQTTVAKVTLKRRMAKTVNFLFCHSATTFSLVR